MTSALGFKAMKGAGKPSLSSDKNVQFVSISRDDSGHNSESNLPPKAMLYMLLLMCNINIGSGGRESIYHNVKKIIEAVSKQNSNVTIITWSEAAKSDNTSSVAPTSHLIE